MIYIYTRVLCSLFWQVVREGVLFFQVFFHHFFLSLIGGGLGLQYGRKQTHYEPSSYVNSFGGPEGKNAVNK